MATQTPLLFLDVDGVLNADAPHVTAAHLYEHVTVVGFPIWFRPDFVRQLEQWHDEGKLEIVWLTTWENAANIDLAPALGMKPHRVIPHVGGSEWRTPPTQWWKLRSVIAELDGSDRPFIWADDLLNRASRTFVRDRFTQRTLLLAPLDPVGLEDWHMERIADFVE